ncbi:hypothetical protein T235_06990 [Tannerella sp. oral taxon BU063 isolate Cell 8/11]|uniref:Uncharacterized protein n=1 Tax=Tannerella sp. oral taxon BU063 isolate Cell 8/11 TaxID=1411915 RepID=W2D091_9BACT|nr:hypothetical protein T235_06990 [Tannerella sp. oral taxon BU063 isolate Cell 8/11]
MLNGRTPQKKVPGRFFISHLPQKIDLKNAFTPFLASKSTSKAFLLDFEPKKVPQKHFDSILSIKKHLKNILSPF